MIVLVINGAIVPCWTLGNIWITTSPCRWIMPKIGGFSEASVPLPGFAFSRRTRPFLPFFWLLLVLLYVLQSHRLHHTQLLLITALLACSQALPDLSWLVICCTSSLFKSSSLAIWWFDRFRPIRYKHNIHVRNGWWCPAKIVPLRSSKFFWQSLHWYR